MKSPAKGIGFVLFSSLSAFSVYSCMYAFRKGFSVGLFEGIEYWGIDYKSLLIIAQAIGYMMSKFFGIKIISELEQKNRGTYILLLIGFSELALLGFAYTPAPLNILFLFLNGLPLGLIWGIVFSYLEGRTATEILGAILSTSFIIAANIAKAVAQWLIIDFNIPENQVPYIVGLIFAIPLIISVKMLDSIPNPDKEDIESRAKREPMTAESRRLGFSSLSSLIVLLVVNYLILTIFRDLRSNYESDIFNALGYAREPSVYLTTTIPVTLFVLFSLGLVFLIKDNMRALMIIQLVVIAGYISVGISSVLFQLNVIDGIWWVVLIGMGTYMSYIPFNCFIFERLIPAFKISGSNIGFFMYIADAFGYMGSVGVLLGKSFFTPEVKWLDFILNLAIYVAIFGTFISVLTIFQRRPLILVGMHKVYFE